MDGIGKNPNENKITYRRSAARLLHGGWHGGGGSRSRDVRSRFAEGMGLGMTLLLYFLGWTGGGAGGSDSFLMGLENNRTKRKGG